MLFFEFQNEDFDEITFPGIQLVHEFGFTEDVMTKNKYKFWGRFYAQGIVVAAEPFRRNEAEAEPRIARPDRGAPKICNCHNWIGMFIKSGCSAVF